MNGIWVAINWSQKAKSCRYLEECMLAASTIEFYLNRVKLFLEKFFGRIPKNLLKTWALYIPLKKAGS